MKLTTLLSGAMALTQLPFVFSAHIPNDNVAIDPNTETPNTETSTKTTPPPDEINPAMAYPPRPKGWHWKIADIEAATSNPFCTANDENSRLCNELFGTIEQCSQSEGACVDKGLHGLLGRLVKANPCEVTSKDDPKNKYMCDKWYNESHRCVYKAKKRPCGHHHLIYLLKELKDVLDLNKIGD